MGEGSGDLFAIEQLNENGFVPTDGENPYSTGAYATGNKLRAIRNYAGNFPMTGAFPTPSTYPEVDPLNFSDIGYDVTGPEVHADAGADLSQNRFTALRSFQIQACDATVASCSTNAAFHTVYTSASDAFPADVPRPVAPMLLLREFTFPAVQATHLRLRVLASQCTGGPAYQGEQDKDPTNATDCNTAGPASTRFIRVAELQAFGSASTVEGSG